MKDCASSDQTNRRTVILARPIFTGPILAHPILTGTIFPRTTLLTLGTLLARALVLARRLFAVLELVLVQGRAA